MNYAADVVSVIIPVYNREFYVGNTIESAINQTYRPLEIIIIDDCSTDKSLDIIKRYAAEYPGRIKCYRLEKNQGVTAARNIGLRFAKGQYIAFQDSDDLWKPDKIVKQIELLKKTNAVLCYTAIEIVNEHNKVIKMKRQVKSKLSYKELLKNTMIATSSVVVDRKVSGRFKMPESRTADGKLFIAEDYATWLKLLRRHGNAVGINEALVQYRKGKGSLSANKFKSLIRVYKTQTRLEHINKRAAVINCVFYILNGVKKHYF